MSHVIVSCFSVPESIWDMTPSRLVQTNSPGNRRSPGGRGSLETESALPRFPTDIPTDFPMDCHLLPDDQSKHFFTCLAIVAPEDTRSAHAPLGYSVLEYNCLRRSSESAKYQKLSTHI